MILDTNTDTRIKHSRAIFLEVSNKFLLLYLALDFVKDVNKCQI